MTPESTEAALFDNLFLSAQKATAFFPGADAGKTAAEQAAEAAEPKEVGEAEREAAKTPTELANEAEEAVLELKTEL